MAAPLPGKGNTAHHRGIIACTRAQKYPRRWRIQILIHHLVFPAHLLQRRKKILRLIRRMRFDNQILYLVNPLLRNPRTAPFPSLPHRTSSGRCDPIPPSPATRRMLTQGTVSPSWRGPIGLLKPPCIVAPIDPSLAVIGGDECLHQLSRWRPSDPAQFCCIMREISGSGSTPINCDLGRSPLKYKTDMPIFPPRSRMFESAGQIEQLHFPIFIIFKNIAKHQKIGCAPAHDRPATADLATAPNRSFPCRPSFAPSAARRPCAADTLHRVRKPLVNAVVAKTVCGAAKKAHRGRDHELLLNAFPPIFIGFLSGLLADRHVKILHHRFVHCPHHQRISPRRHPAEDKHDDSRTRCRRSDRRS